MAQKYWSNGKSLNGAMYLTEILCVCEMEVIAIGAISLAILRGSAPKNIDKKWEKVLIKKINQKKDIKKPNKEGEKEGNQPIGVVIVKKRKRKS